MAKDAWRFLADSSLSVNSLHGEQKDPYESKIVHSDREVKKLTRQGWEVMGQSGGFLASGRTYTLRRPNPKYTGDFFSGMRGEESTPFAAPTQLPTRRELRAAAASNAAFQPTQPYSAIHDVSPVAVLERPEVESDYDFDWDNQNTSDFHAYSSAPIYDFAQKQPGLIGWINRNRALAAIIGFLAFPLIPLIVLVYCVVATVYKRSIGQPVPFRYWAAITICGTIVLFTGVMAALEATAEEAVAAPEVQITAPVPAQTPAVELPQNTNPQPSDTGMTAAEIRQAEREARAAERQAEREARDAEREAQQAAGAAEREAARQQRLASYLDPALNCGTASQIADVEVHCSLTDITFMGNQRMNLYFDIHPRETNDANIFMALSYFRSHAHRTLGTVFNTVLVTFQEGPGILVEHEGGRWVIRS